MNRLCKNTIKRSTVFVMVLAILLTTTIVAYAVVALFFKGEEQSSSYTKKTYFEFDSSSFFSATGEVGPGESMSINPVITSDATEDMYVFIRVEMPAYNNSGLYILETNGSWTAVETGTADGKYVVVYGYSEILTPGSSTTALSSSLTMVDMTKTDYAALEDINVTMTGYACGAEGIDLTTAWESVKGNYGV